MELKRMVIIDDEPLIASGLAEKMDWSSMGIRIVGTACNGEQGLKLIDETMPDIVVSDIVMPALNGIQLAELCAQRYPNMKIILLSAHSDFTYAQQAIRLNITDYVLKPVEPEKLSKAVHLALDALREQDGLMEHVSRLETSNIAARRFASSFLMFEAAQKNTELSGVQTKKDLEYLFQNPGVVIAFRFYNVPSGGMKACISAMRESLFSYLESHKLHAFFRTGPADITILCCLPNNIDWKTGRARVAKVARSALNELREEILNAGDQNTICIGVLSAVYKDIQELKATYQKCMNCVPLTFFETQSRIIQIEDIVSGSAQNSDHSLIFHYLKCGNLQKMLAELENAYRDVTDNRDLESANLLLKNLRKDVLQACTLAGITQLPMNSVQYEQENFFQRAAGLKQLLIAVCDSILDMNDLVRRMQLLVKECFCDSTFGLSTISEVLGISGSYLSRLFKKRTGQNFIDHLLETRISHAKFLLETSSLSIAEISQKSGFSESTYFTQVFKKNVGLTPSQYRANLLQS